MGAARAGIALLLGGLLMLAATAPAQAGGLEDAYRRGRLKVGVRTDFPPFGYKDPAGEIQGFDADLARALAQTLFAGDSGVELVPVTSGGRIPLLYSELIDVVVGALTVTEDRQRVLDFSAPYFVTGSLLLTRRDSAIQGVADLAGKPVAVISGAVQEKDLPSIAPEARVVAFESLPEALRALERAAVEAVCQDGVVLLAEARANPAVRIAGPSFLPRPYAMAVRKGDRRLLDWLNARLASLESDGIIRQLRRKHFGDLEAHLLAPQ
jgi:ABC-type amino acid transport substrate-binding protein